MNHKRIALIAYPQTLATSITLPAEILTGANQQISVSKKQQSKLIIKLATTTDKPIITTGNLTLTPNALLHKLGELDLIILPSMWRHPARTVEQNPHLVTLLQQYHQHQTLICAVGTGAYFLAAAGLLNNRPATTHWYYQDDFANRYPEVNLQSQHMITKSDNLYCAGSINAVADLSSHFIERFYGPQTARHIEGQFSPEIRRSYRSYGYFDGEVNTHQDELITDIQQWLHDHCNQPIKLTELARQYQLNPRTFNRRFKQAIGSSPKQYLTELRLTQAKDLLRQSNLNISEIANQVGYDDYSYFSALFSKHVGFSPSKYRQSSQSKLFETAV